MQTDSSPDVQVDPVAPESSWSRLVDLVRAGDPAGLEELYAVFAKGVRFFLWRQIGPQDLDDKVHDAFLIITQSIQRGDLREPERLMGYVRTIVRRQVAAHIQTAVRARRCNRPIEQLLTLSDRRLDPERSFIARESHEVAMAVLNGLPQRDREVLVRFYLREQTADEICSELGLTETQFRLIKSRAKARYGKLGQRRIARRAMLPAA
ncbi:MAG: polymerase, sigma-24 subunit, subfamily [Candidatus Solibacter sp.]|nr:polymerase, sigma-24 subunit, subfamily [Candidatus Solibacter sp.]